jgi:hypothetical protein
MYSRVFHVMSERNIFDQIAPNYDSVMKESGQEETLMDHIGQVLNGLEFKTVLDVGIGTGLSTPAYLNGRVIHVLASEPSEGMRGELEAKFSDGRLVIDEKPIVEINLDGKYDLALFSLSLAWINDQVGSVEHVLRANPRYVVISEQVVDEEQKQSVGTGHQERGELRDEFNPISAEKLDQIMSRKGYFPLRILRDPISSANGESAGQLRTTLYTKTKPDAVPYENADTIFQINAYCNRRCDGCYSSFNKDSLDVESYLRRLERIPKGNLVTFRGGEPTLHPTWFEDYVSEALARGLDVIVETNGAFIDRRSYETDMGRFSDDRIHVRLSFDDKHIAELNPAKREAEFSKLAGFANHATERGISFGFYSLGMDKHQISRMIVGTELEPYGDRFHSLTFYSNINDLKMNGDYVDVSGHLHDSLVS